MKKNVIKVWACGGTGINVVKGIQSSRKDVSFAALDTVYVDTSDSNMRSGFEKETSFIFDNVDGSGKFRAENVDIIRKQMPALMSVNEAAEFNIVVTSGSGGSGSVIGPLLLNELLSMDKTAVIVVLGTNEDEVAVTNSANTLKSLQGISKMSKTPVIMHWVYQSDATEKAIYDERMRTAICALSSLASQRNARLDSKDVANFINYSKVTSYKPMLTALDISYDENVYQGTIISTVNLLRDDTDIVQQKATYIADGYLPEGSDRCIRFAVTPDLLPKYVTKLNSELEHYHEVRAAIESSSDLKVEDCDDDGMVF